MTTQSVHGINFDEALKNKNYIRMMNHAGKRFRKYIPSQELAQIKRIALWKTILKYNPEKSGFRTYLFLHVKWGCLSFLKKHFTNLDHFSKNMELKPKDSNICDIKHNENKEFVDSILKQIPEDFSQLIRWYYLENMTLKQISLKNGFTPERNRKKILKGLLKLKEKCKGVYNE